MIEAKIVTDSIGPNGQRITTYGLTYPRFCHSELMTHRMFSRNASSSRAIPVKKQMQMIIDEPAMPIAFLANKPGMQAGEKLNPPAHLEAVNTWLDARDEAVKFAQKLLDLGVHKQFTNRLLEPWQHITVVCTATDYDNFFALRYHPDAQPEICELAKQMYEAREASTPKQLKEGQWHLPFITPDDWQKQYNRICSKYVFPEQVSDQERNAEMIKISVARCARVSYLNHDGTDTTLEQDFQLYERLIGHKPIHASPAEHQAMAIGDPNVRSGNFKGFIQFRQTLLGNNITEFKP